MDQGQLLIQEILNRLNEVVSDLKELKKENSLQNEDRINIKRDLQDAIRKIKELENMVNDNKQKLDNIDNAKTEIKGFVKYIKLIWGVLLVLAGYFIKHITFK